MGRHVKLRGHDQPIGWAKPVGLISRVAATHDDPITMSFFRQCRWAV